MWFHTPIVDVLPVCRERGRERAIEVVFEYLFQYVRVVVRPEERGDGEHLHVLITLMQRPNRLRV